MISVTSLASCLVAYSLQSTTIFPVIAPLVSPTPPSKTSPTSVRSASLSATSTANNRATLMSSMTFSNADNGKTLTLKPGQKITLRLNENPTTGYRWSTSAFNSQILQLIDDRFDLPDTSAMGGGGQRVLTFQANQLGQVTLNLKNRQEWEDEASALESFNLTLQVAE